MDVKTIWQKNCQELYDAESGYHRLKNRRSLGPDMDSGREESKQEHLCVPVSEK